MHGFHSRSACLFLAATASAFAAPPDRIAGPVNDAQMVALRASAIPGARPASDLGRVDPAMPVNAVSLVFSRSAGQQAELDRLLGAQQDPRSPEYHKWLSPEQFGDRFGLSDNDLAKIAAWLQSEGLTVYYSAPSRTSLAFSGSAAQMERAFHTEMHYYLVDGKTRFAPVSDPSIPAAIKTIVMTIRGLNNMGQRAHPNFTFSPGIYGLLPGDLAIIYDVNPLYQAGYTGAGQTIAVMGQSNVLLSDVQGFRAKIGLPSNNPQVLLYPGSTDPGTSNTSNREEATLDLELAGGMAPAASVTLVYGEDIFAALQYTLENNLAGVVSFSADTCEAALTGGQSSANAVRLVVQQANAQGATVVAGSADYGAADCDRFVTSPANPATQGLAVAFPADIPEVTAVGGTNFPVSTETSAYWSNTNNATTMASALGYIPEIPWNLESGGQFGATGGGASTFFSKPTWQTGTNVPGDGRRDLPDVSLYASDGYVFEFNGATATTAGTSASTQVFAGMLAVLNQYLVATGAQSKSGLGNINPALYSLAQSDASLFHDITTGNNDVYCRIGTPDCTTGIMGYPAGPGYDQVTGLGSIDAYQLFTHWTSASGGSSSGPVITAKGGVYSAASYQAGIAPNSWVAISGTNLSAVTDSWTNAVIDGKLPTMLDGVSVSVGGLQAYISYVSPGQINILAPNVATGNVPVIVQNSAGVSTAVTASVQTFQPAFFLWNPYAVATRTDYSLAVKDGTFPGLTTVPAKPGDTIILWGTGFGPTIPTAPVGSVVPSTTTYNTANAVTVTVGNLQATVLGAHSGKRRFVSGSDPDSEYSG